MATGIVGVQFNVVKTSDGKLALQWDEQDSINRQVKHCMTIHEDFTSLQSKLAQVLGTAGVTS